LHRRFREFQPLLPRLSSRPTPRELANAGFPASPWCWCAGAGWNRSAGSPKCPVLAFWGASGEISIQCPAAPLIEGVSAIALSLCHLDRLRASLRTEENWRDPVQFPAAPLIQGVSTTDLSVSSGSLLSPSWAPWRPLIVCLMWPRACPERQSVSEDESALLAARFVLHRDSTCVTASENPWHSRPGCAEMNSGLGCQPFP
jgi:hypothetical protein